MLRPYIRETTPLAAGRAAQMPCPHIDMIIIVGLGNPGRAYSRHRHNVGARCLQYLGKRYGIPLEQRLPGCRGGRGVIESVEVVLARPQTYMNESGVAVWGLLRRFRSKPADLLVICDDLDLPLGKLRLRARGSAGGHRGLTSIIAALGTQDFPRLRVGIGRPHEETRRDKDDAVVSHVLSGFTAAEEKALEEVYPQMAEGIACFLNEGIQAAMNRLN